MKLHRISISVRDLEKSIKFYTELFNCTEEQRFDRKELAAKGALLRLGEVLFELWEMEEQRPAAADANDLHVLGLKNIAFEVENIEQIQQQLKEWKIICSEPKKGESGTYLFLTDPNGVAIQLFQP